MVIAVETFGQRLKKLRDKKGISQAELGRHLGVTQQAIGHYETDRNEPSQEATRFLARFFNVSAEYLLCLSDNPEPLKENGNKTEIDWDAPLKEKDLESALIKISDMTYQYSLPIEKRMELAEKVFKKFGPPVAAVEESGEEYDIRAAHGPKYPGSGALNKNQTEDD